MARPQISDATIDRLNKIANQHAKVPATQLTTDQRVNFLLDELADANSRIRNLNNKIDTLESQLNDSQGDTTTAGGLNQPRGSGSGFGNGL